MSSPVQESYRPLALVASGIVVAQTGGAIGGFLCTTTGNLKLSYSADGSGETIVDTVAVTAGIFLPMPFIFAPGTTVYATLSGGAKGTFAIL